MSLQVSAHILWHVKFADPAILLSKLGDVTVKWLYTGDFEDAITPGYTNGYYLGFYRKWWIIFDHLGYYIANGIHVSTDKHFISRQSSTLAILSPASKALSFYLDGYAGIAAFSWYVRGRLIRSRFWESGHLRLDYGLPLLGEDTLLDEEVSEEERVLRLINTLTVPWDSIRSLRYHFFGAIRLDGRLTL